MTAFADSALSLAVMAVRSHLEKAHAAEAGTAARCTEYVHAAREAVRGLEHEYDEILDEASDLDLDDSAKREMLLARIDRFVRHESLRPMLETALEGLHEAQAALERSANRFFRRLAPADRGRQLMATDRISQLLQELVGYLEGLTPSLTEEYMRDDRPNPSAPELHRLLELEKLVTHAGILQTSAARQRVREQISDMLTHRDKGQFLYLAREAGGAAEQLQTAFA